MRVVRLLIRVAALRFLLATGTGAFAGLIAGALIALLRSAARGMPSARAGVVFAVLCVAHIGFHLYSRIEVYRVLHVRVIPEFRRSLVARILSSPLKRIEEAGRGRLIGLLTEDTAHVGFAASAWMVASRSVAAILATLAYLAVSAPDVFPVLLGALVAAIVLSMLLSAASVRAATSARPLQARATADLSTAVNAVRELKVVDPRRSDFLKQSLEPNVRAAQRALSRSSALGAVSSAWASIAMLAALGVLLFVWPAHTVAADLLAAYAFAFVFLQTELATILDLIALARGGDAALQSMEELHLDPEPESSTPPPTEFRSIELRGVTHTYRREDVDADFTLGPLDFTVAPGEIVFIVGGNGSGKSTLAKLLVGLYAPESGTIAVDGDPFAADRVEDYRALFTAILSDWHVFDRLYGLGGADLDARGNHYLTKLRLDRKVQVENGAFSTVALSQGQRKRLALVTAYLEDRPICLFDEWASDQDPVFKDVFYRELLPELRARGRTAIVISHDDAYFDVADRVVRLEDGRIAEARAA